MSDVWDAFDCACDVCSDDCPEVVPEQGDVCLACRHGLHPATVDE